MKQFWIALSMLAAFFCATLGNALYLRSLAGEVSALLVDAEARWLAEDTEDALSLTEEAEALWDSHAAYLHTTLRHSDIDTVHSCFRQTLALLRHEGEGEYAAANAVLLSALKLVAEQEQFTLKNIL